MLTCVILNYNDVQSTTKLYNQIKDYKVLDHIILVDGKSTDDSYKKLNQLSSPKTTVLLADKNGGYGYGNNIGLRYSQKLGATHVLIVNPDVLFEENAIKNCLALFKKYPQAIAVSPRVSQGQPAYKFAIPITDITTISLVLNKLIKPRYYRRTYFIGKDVCSVDVLPVSLVLFDLNKFSRCDFYDENIFLYNEEISIARKFERAGYLSLLNLQETYQHFHSVSVNKSLKTVKIKTLNLQSHYYYLKRYANASYFTLLLFKLLTPFALLESILWGKIKLCIKK